MSRENCFYLYKQNNSPLTKQKLTITEIIPSCYATSKDPFGHLPIQFENTVCPGMQHDALKLCSCPCQCLFSLDLKEFSEVAVTTVFGREFISLPHI